MGRKTKKRSNVNLTLVDLPGKESEAKKAKKDSSSSSSSSESSHSDSSSSSDSDRKHSKRKKKRKHTKSCSYVKRLQKKMDLFTQNIDIKLNYMENLMQTLIKLQSTNTEMQKPKIKSVQLKKIKYPELSIPEGEPQYSEDPLSKIEKPQSPSPKILFEKKTGFKPLSLGALKNPDMSHIGLPVKDEHDQYQLPRFPLSDLEQFFIFDKHLSYPEYMNFAVESLYQNCTSVSIKRIALRVKKLLYGIMSCDLLTQFTWSGRSNNIHTPGTEASSKYAFCNLRGMVELTKNCVDYDTTQKLPIYELVTAFKETIKRNKDRLTKRKKSGPLDFIGENDDSFMGTDGNFVNISVYDEEQETKEEKYNIRSFE